MVHVSAEQILLTLQIIIKDAFLNETPVLKYHLGELTDELDNVFFIIELDETFRYRFSGKTSPLLSRINSLVDLWLTICFNHLEKEDNIF